MLVAYAVFFAISAGTTRTAGYILAVIGGVVVVQVLAAVADLEVQLLQAIMDRILIWPGPLEIFTGRWMLIDV